MSTKDQHNVGTPEKPRGQQTGFDEHPDQNREEVDETPAVRGNRVGTNKLAGDPSSQHISSDPVSPGSITPSTAGMNTPAKGESGGEGVFKRRLEKTRKES